MAHPESVCPGRGLDCPARLRLGEPLLCEPRPSAAGIVANQEALVSDLHSPGFSFPLLTGTPEALSERCVMRELLSRSAEDQESQELKLKLGPGLP